MNNDHFQVSEKAVLLINNNNYFAILQHDKRLLSKIILQLFINTKFHWNKMIVGLSINTIKYVIDVIGEDLFDSITNDLKI